MNIDILNDYLLVLLVFGVLGFYGWSILTSGKRRKADEAAQQKYIDVQNQRLKAQEETNQLLKDIKNLLEDRKS